MRLVEIRSYKLKPGAAQSFSEAFTSLAVPMLFRWKTDVVSYGQGAAEDDTFFLVRSYSSLADLQKSQGEFYGSSEWRDGPRHAIVSRIESHLSTALWLPDAALEAMRRANPPGPLRALPRGHSAPR